MAIISSSAGMADIEDLIAYFQQQLTLEDAWPKICQPETAMSEMHISGKLGSSPWKGEAGVSFVQIQWVSVVSANIQKWLICL